MPHPATFLASDKGGPVGLGQRGGAQKTDSNGFLQRGADERRAHKGGGAEKRGGGWEERAALSLCLSAQAAKTGWATS